MGPAPEETREGGPTKPSDKMETKLPKQITSTDHPSSQLMMELPNPLKESLNKIYQGLEELVKYMAGVEKKTDEALHRVGKLENRVGGLEDRINKAEEKIGKLEENVNNLEKYVNEGFGYVVNILGLIEEIIKRIPVRCRKLVKVKPGTPGAKLFVVEDENGEKRVEFYKIEEEEVPAGEYEPVKNGLNELDKYMRDFIERSLKKYENKYAKSS